MSVSADTKDLAKLPIPREIYLAVMKVMTDENLDWAKACERTAQLINSNSDEFKKAVDAKANRLYKKRHMAEQNKTINKFKTELKELEENRDYLLKFIQDFETFKIPCSICGKPMSFNNKHDNWETEIYPILLEIFGKHHHDPKCPTWLSVA